MSENPFAVRGLPRTGAIIHRRLAATRRVKNEVQDQSQVNGDVSCAATRTAKGYGVQASTTSADPFAGGLQHRVLAAWHVS
eukprot:CAMPEP_0174383866 /NCGR_PEP_ID=MMETSP0811_2-20130205/125535_1 /TAXON_ID=73025 ORGANISM="Eutreptiella gymnastica-like, Strain CCMP1594" /NCGR_SAMPLE_ID=MMETSP0811_2 /ASSEMBLY_ACC=CAM_ASM_000667 /LENGTH=80 /DNA_ID=CAMNT_0015537627 /DNA_START=615 /DNA_END=857 /DNA_ORIENTATION=+